MVTKTDLMIAWLHGLVDDNHEKHLKSSDMISSKLKHSTAIAILANFMDDVTYKTFLIKT